MKYIVVLSLALLVAASAAPLHAQQATTSVGTQSAEVPDEVIATARKQTDPAMSAFLSGDYETAEIEFDKNAFCALRIERNFRAGVESARDSALRSELAGTDGTPSTPLGGPGSTIGIGAAAAADASTGRGGGLNSSNFESSKIRRTCENRGFQIYMKGLSQLELGKTAEAKQTLSQATKIHRTLYDAHFKLSLLEYQEGNLDKAQKELKKLRKIAKRCRRCVAKPEIEGQVNYLDVLLNQ